MNTLILSFLNRFKEPSSWAAISVALTQLGIQLPDGVAEHASYILAGIAGIAAFFISEKN